MKGKSRKREVKEFLEMHDLFVPQNPKACDAIYRFIQAGNRYKLGGALPSERIKALKDATEKFKGRLVTHRKWIEQRRVLLVLYVMPKTETEIFNQMVERASDIKEQLEIAPIHPFKVCVKASPSTKPFTVRLDMVELVEGTE